MNSVEVTCAAFIPPKPIDWIWQDYLAAGKLTLLAGASGTGKTLIAMSIAATVSNGGVHGHRWPDGSFSPTGDVLIWSGEDGIEDTIIPRLMAANADLLRIHIIGATHDRGKRRPFDFEKDLPFLEAHILQNRKFRLLIIDSIVQVVSGDAHKNLDVRRALEPLIALAEEHGFAILGITHVNKNSKGKNPLDRVTGSLAFAAVSRGVLMTSKVASDQLEDESQCSVLVRAKSNLGPDNGGFLYETQGATVMAAHRPIETSRVAWRDVVEGSAIEILAWAEGGDSTPEVGAVGQAKTFLLNQLANGPLPAKVVESAAAAVGISPSSLRRAKKASGIIYRKTAACTLLELPSTASYPMPAMSLVRYDRSGHAHPFPNQQFNIAAMPQGMTPIFSPLDHLDQVGPLDQLGPVAQEQATIEFNSNLPAIPSYLLGTLTPKAHQSWYQEGINICRQRFRLALHQNASAGNEDQEDVFDVARAVVDRVIDDLFYPDMENYNLLVEYYRAVFEDALNKAPGAN